MAFEVNPSKTVPHYRTTISILEVSAVEVPSSCKLSTLNAKVGTIVVLVVLNCVVNIVCMVPVFPNGNLIDVVLDAVVVSRVVVGGVRNQLLCSCLDQVWR